VKHRLPQTFSEVVDEVVRFTAISRCEAERRVWMESLELGWNVRHDVERFKVTPHQYDEHMERLYREGDGFIFETLVFWAAPNRQMWTAGAAERLFRYSEKAALLPNRLRILMLGDGAGSDSLYLANQGFCLDYFDVPGSLTSDFALKRFDYYGVLGENITVVDNYEQCLSSGYDAVITFEVLEHLPQPLEAIRDISRMLKTKGIALVTEAFEVLIPELPTHLAANRKYAARTPFLFLRNNLLLNWHNPPPIYRPAEYVKLEGSCLQDWLHLLKDKRLLMEWSLARAREFKRRIVD